VTSALVRDVGIAGAYRMHVSGVGVTRRLWTSLLPAAMLEAVVDPRGPYKLASTVVRRQGASLTPEGFEACYSID